MVFVIIILATMLSDLPFAGSPIPVVLLLLFYLLIVKKIGPALMEHHKPYNPRKWIMAYNIFQIFANLYMFYYVCVHAIYLDIMILNK